MTALLTDIRLGLRALLRAPGFTVTAVVTLGLGMALCTAAMVVVNAYLLHDLPYPEADRLHWIRYDAPGRNGPREMERLDWASLSDVIEHPVAWDLDVFYLLGGDNAESIQGAWVTPGFVQGLGIAPALGQGFAASAFEPGAANEVLISHRLWTTRFGGDSSVAGRTFTAYVSDRPEETESFTIIGVLPEGFWHLNAFTDILAPLRAPTYPYMARLRGGVSRQHAAARVTALVTAGARDVPPNWKAEVVATHELYVARVRPILRTVAVAAGLVLLVACANVAGLLLVRATRRRKEIAIRTALGAGRAAIARMLLAEAVVLGGAATLVGLLLTRLTLDSLAPLIQTQLGRSAPGGTLAFALDARVMAFAAAAGILTTMVCALAPLAASLRPRLLGAMQDGGRAVTEGRGNRRIRPALIALEIAASLALIAGSTLMVRTVVTLLNADLGFTAGRVLMGSTTLRQNRYPDPASRVAVTERMLTAVAAIPGAESVALTTSSPLQQGRLQPVEATGTSGPASTRAAVHGISSDYFATLDIPLAAGRFFTASDRVGGEAVTIVSETLAGRLWPDGRGIGQRVTIPQAQDQGEPLPVSRLVVGIARDVRQGPADDDLADAYVPLLQTPGRFALVLLRATASPAALITPFRAALRRIDPEIAVDRARPLQAAQRDITAGPRFLASLLGAFALMATALALVGVYGVIAYAVRQREREIAVRMAIGADPRRIVRLFVRQGAVMLSAGLALGALGAVGAGRLLESQLFGVAPGDPLALTSAVVAFGAAGWFAVWWPARRAAATDPAVALRAE